MSPVPIDSFQLLDAPWIRYFTLFTPLYILYLVICETLATGFDIGMMYEPLVLRYATPRTTTILPIGEWFELLRCSVLDPIMTVCISTPVQLFICWRIKALSGSRLLPAIISGGISTTVAGSILHQFAQEHQYAAAVVAWLGSSATADICITGCLVWSLHKRRTGYSATDDLLNKLIRLTLQTGAITAISATLDVVFFLAASVRAVPILARNFIWDFSLSKLYTNSLLSTLNARAGWNNVTGDQLYRDNVLFGESEFVSAGGNHPVGERSNVYSLELRFRSDNSVARDDGRRDIESEIPVPKVVERFEEIPPVTRD
ncbi:hypothetical protein JB92DRAFT_2897370 [Gautieria morchelliformis]|nr:hypothetical protein JB92DRAFT_2897370 [Gautieria morchelliformis]